MSRREPARDLREVRLFPPLILIRSCAPLFHAPSVAMFPLLSAPLMHSAWVQPASGARSSRAPQTLRAAEREVRAQITALVRTPGVQPYAPQQHEGGIGIGLGLGIGGRPPNSTGLAHMPVMRLDARGQPIPVSVVVRTDSSMMMDAAIDMHEAEEEEEEAQQIEFDEAQQQQFEEDERVDDPEAEIDEQEPAEAESASDQSGDAAASARASQFASDAEDDADGDEERISDSMLLEMDPSEMSEEQQVRLLELRYEQEQEAQAIAASSPAPVAAAASAAASAISVAATPVAAASSRSRVPFSLARALPPAASAVAEEEDERDFMASDIGRALHRAMAQQSPPHSHSQSQLRQQELDESQATEHQQQSGFVTPPMHGSRAASLLSAGASAVSAPVAAASARARAAAAAAPASAASSASAAAATGARRTLDLDSSSESMDLSSTPPHTPPSRAASAVVPASAAAAASSGAGTVPRALSFRTPTSPQRRTQAPASAASISEEMASELGLSPEEMEELMAQQMHAMQQIQMLRSS